MRIIDADALQLCHYDFEEYGIFPFRAVPEETLEEAPTLVVGPDGDVVPEKDISKWISPKEGLPEKTGTYLAAFRSTNGSTYTTNVTFLKDDPIAKDGFYEGYTQEDGYISLSEKILYWLKVPEIPKGEDI